MKFLSLSLATLIVPLAILGGLLVAGVSEFFDAFLQGNEEVVGGTILATILQFGFVKWLIATFFYTIGSFVVVLLSLVIAMIVLGFLTPIVVSTLHKRYYADVTLQAMGGFDAFKMISAVFFKFIILLILCLPFIFFPFVINIPFLYLFYKLLLIDVGSNIMPKEPLLLFEKQNFMQIFLLCVIFFILSLIPVVGIFLQLFFAIYLTHYFFTHLTPNQ